MDHTQVLLYSVQGDTEPIVRFTPFGEPVWPVSNEAERCALANLAATFGAEFREATDAGAYESSIAATASSVIGVGPVARDAAKLYARLTNRQLRLYDRPSDFAVEDDADVVIIDGNELNSDLLDDICETGHAEYALGVVSGRGARDLRRRALLASAASRLTGPIGSGRIDLMPLLAMDEVQLEDRIVLGGESTPEQVDAAVRQKAGLLSVFTHSDGVCAHLGPKVLCPLVEKWPQTSDERRRPVCIANSNCHRLRLPLGEALADSRLLSPATIASRVLLLGTCYGLLPSTALIEPVWGHTDVLLASGRVGAVITAWGLSFGLEIDIQPLAQDIVAGAPLGIALANFKCSDAAQAGRMRLCLLGDPKLRLPAPLFSSPRQPTSTLPAWSFPSAGQDFLPLLLVVGQQCAPADCQSLFAVALVAAETMRAGETLSHADRGRCLKAIASTGSMPSRLWLSLGPALRRTEYRNDRCEICKQRIHLYSAQLPVADGHCRELVVCPNCGVLDDRPKASPALSLKVQDGQLLLSGSLPGRWSAGVRIESFGKEKCIWLDWPENDSKGSFSAGNIQPHLPRGYSFVSMFIISDAGDFRVLTLPTYR